MRWVIVGLVAALVIAGGGGGYMVYTHNQDTPKRASSNAGSVSASAKLDIPQAAPRSQTASNTRPPRRKRRESTTKFAAPQFRGFDPDKSFEAGEVVVVDPPTGFADAARRIGYLVSERIDLDELGMTMFRVNIPSGVSVPEAGRRLAAQFPGLVIDANHQMDPSQERTPKRRRAASPRRASSSSDKPVLSRARAAMGWDNISNSCGQGVRLGQIDSGVDMNHPALKGQKVSFRSFHNPKRKQGPSNHGTAVAALLIGKPTPKGWGGILPGAELFAANMFEFNKTGKKVGNVIALLKGLNWIAKQNVHAVNLSIAGSKNRAVDKAFSLAKKKGLVMVAAAGNWGRADKPAYPAAYNEVVAVTAVGPYRAPYKHANKGDYIDFAAPGVRLWTAVASGGKYQSGTSFAAPYLTALIGLEISKGGSKNTDSLRDKLRPRTADLGVPGKDITFGWGIVDKPPSC